MEHIRFYKTGSEIVCVYCAQTCSISVDDKTVLNLTLLVKKIMNYKTDIYVRYAYYEQGYLMDKVFYIF
jgi:CxxC motif-containing protein